MPASKILTMKENECLLCLEKAQALFDEITKSEPQDPADSYNFGHYIDAARNALLIRGARRMDPGNLLPARKHINSMASQILSTITGTLAKDGEHHE